MAIMGRAVWAVVEWAGMSDTTGLLGAYECLDRVG
jgi:hypothetical protein